MAVAHLHHRRLQEAPSGSCSCHLCIRQCTEGLQEAVGVATWVNKTGKECQEVLVSVLTNSKGQYSLSKMDYGLMGTRVWCLIHYLHPIRYREAGKASTGTAMHGQKLLQWFFQVEPAVQ